MMNQWVRVAVLAAFVGTAGCATQMSQDERAQRTKELEYNTVVFTDYDLNRNFSEDLMGPDKVIRISAGKHGIRRTATGTSEVWAVLRNHTDHDYVVEARTRFYAEGGMPVDADPVWKRVIVPANAVATYREKSVSTDKLQYRVEVRQTK
jgi:hypothetical protein